MIEHENRSILPFQYDNFSADVQLYGTHSGTVGRGWVCPRHVHPMMFEINIVLEGCQTVILDRVTYEQLENDLIILPRCRYMNTR